MFHVDPDLVCAASVEDAEDEGGAVVLCVEGVVVGDGGLAGTGIDDGHFLSRDGVAADLSENGAAWFIGWVLEGGEVELAGLAVGELANE